MKQLKRGATLILCMALACTLAIPVFAGNGFMNGGTFINNAGATFNNRGTFENYSAKAGSLINNGSFSGSGEIRLLTDIGFTGSGTFSQSPSRYYTLTFDYATTGYGIESQTVISGGYATRPTDPTKAGYTFDGWYSDEALTTVYDFTTPVTGATTIYAKWTESSSSATTGSIFYVSDPSIKPIYTTDGQNYYEITVWIDGESTPMKTAADETAFGTTANPLLVQDKLYTVTSTNSLGWVTGVEALDTETVASYDSSTFSLVTDKATYVIPHGGSIDFPIYEIHTSLTYVRRVTYTESFSLSAGQLVCPVAASETSSEISALYVYGSSTTSSNSYAYAIAQDASASGIWLFAHGGTIETCKLSVNSAEITVGEVYALELDDLTTEVTDDYKARLFVDTAYRKKVAVTVESFSATTDNPSVYNIVANDANEITYRAAMNSLNTNIGVYDVTGTSPTGVGVTTLNAGDQLMLVYEVNSEDNTRDILVGWRTALGT